MRFQIANATYLQTRNNPGVWQLFSAGTTIVDRPQNAQAGDIVVGFTQAASIPASTVSALDSFATMSLLNVRHGIHGGG